MWCSTSHVVDHMYLRQTSGTFRSVQQKYLGDNLVPKKIQNPPKL